MSNILASLVQGLTLTEYKDWVRFVERLRQAIESESVRKISVVKVRWSPDEEWILDKKSGEVYVYVPPNPPVMPRWEKLDVLKHLEPKPDPAPLSVFKIGPLTPMQAHIIKLNLELLVSRGLADPMATPASVLPSKDGTEKWFRDTVSNIVYRLIEYYPLRGVDDIRWEVVPQAETSGRIQ